MSIERWLEFHDSKLIAVHEAADLVRVEVDAYIHQWEGSGASRRGTGWIQRVTFEIEGPTTGRHALSMPCDIWSGHVRARSLPPDEDGTLSVPAIVDDPCVLEVLTTSGETLTISGRRLRATPSGEARFVEPLRADMDPQTMSEECVIRAASPADYEATCALFDELDARHRDQLPWLFRASVDRPRSQDYFDKVLSSPDSSILLATATSRIVGLATVRMHSAPEFAVFIPQRWGVIDDIIVVPSWRRRGIGARLARAAENWANERGAAWLELGVYDFNTEARAFYEALGYLPVSTKLRRPLSGAG